MTSGLALVATAKGFRKGLSSLSWWQSRKFRAIVERMVIGSRRGRAMFCKSRMPTMATEKEQA